LLRMVEQVRHVVWDEEMKVCVVTALLFQGDKDTVLTFAVRVKEQVRHVVLRNSNSIVQMLVANSGILYTDVLFLWLLLQRLVSMALGVEAWGSRQTTAWEPD